MTRLLRLLSNDRWLPLLPLVAFPLLLVAPLLITGRALFWGLPVLQFNPWRLYAWEVLRSGHLPLWNALNGMGAPLMANYQLALWYPPSWPLYLFAALGGGPALAWGHTLLYALHLVWAGLGMARLLRYLGAGRLAQTVSGLAFSLCGYMLARSGVLPMTWTAAWLPWVIYGASQIAIPGRGLSAPRPYVPVTLVASLAMMLLAGHAQLSWYTLLLAAAWVLVGALLRTRLQSGLSATMRVVFRFSLSGLLAAGLAAIQLIPTAELLLHSQRSSAVDYELGMTYSLWPWRFLDLLAPNAFGNPGTGTYWGYAAYWEDAIYLGLLPLLLALTTLRCWQRREKEHADPIRGLQRFLWLAAALAFVLALGKNTPLFPFLYRYVPSFSLFQAPTRFSILAIFALALLAGLGADGWRKPGGKRLQRLKQAVVAAAAVVIGALAAGVMLDNTRPTLTIAFALAGGWAFLSGLLTLRLPPAEETARRARWSWAVVAVIGLDLLLAGRGLLPGAPARLYRADEPQIAQVSEELAGGRLYLPAGDEYLIKFSRFFRFTDFRPLEPWENLRPVLLPNANLLDGIPSANNFDPLLPGRYAAWMEHVENLPKEQRAPWLRLMGVSLVEERTVNSPGGVTFTALDGATRWYWASCAVVSYSATESLEQVAARLGAQGGMGSDVILETASSLPDCTSSEAQIRLLREDPGRLEFSVTASATGMLVLSDTWYPGWRAMVDGLPVPVEIANHTFRSVVVPPGQHVVLFSYAPSSFTVGWIITLLSNIVLVSLFARRRILR